MLLLRLICGGFLVVRFGGISLHVNLQFFSQTGCQEFQVYQVYQVYQTSLSRGGSLFQQER
jgi:hypothetical protein